MKAMRMSAISDLSREPNPLALCDIPIPEPLTGEALVKVSVCGVCHTELDILEGRTPPAFLPITPGHQVVGTVVSVIDTPSALRPGDRVGAAWIHSACGVCSACSRGNENLCSRFKGNGRDADGGYAQYMTAPVDFLFPIPSSFSDEQAAPLLCAGAVGYRALRLCQLQPGQILGLSGFGASAHLVLQLVKSRQPSTSVFVFARSAAEREFASQLGADWTGDFDARSPEALDCIIDTTPVWSPILSSLERLKSGGRLVINAIRKESQDQNILLKLSYPTHLWMEKTIQSVANVTRADVKEFLTVAAEANLQPEVREFALHEANHALRELKERNIRGAKVLRISHA